MKRPRFTIARAMLIILVIGVVLAWMRANIGTKWVVSAAPATLLLALPLLIARVRPWPILIVFTGLGWTYCLSVAFLLRDIPAENAGDGSPVMLNTCWFNAMHDYLHPRCDCYIRYERTCGNLPGRDRFPIDREESRRIGHAATGLLLGVMGGTLCHFYAASRRSRQQTEFDFGEPDDFDNVPS
jgi:hypothetical protein